MASRGWVLGWMVYHAQNPVSICGMTQDDSGWLRMTQDDSGWCPMTCFYMLNPGMRGHLLRQELATPWNAEAAWKACQVRLSCEFNKTGAAWFICKNDFSWFLSIYIYIDDYIYIWHEWYIQWYMYHGDPEVSVCCKSRFLRMSSWGAATHL